MKRLIVTLRLGTPIPLPKELPLIRKILDGEMEMGVGSPLSDVGVISILYTNWTPKEIETGFKELAEETNDTLPIIAFELGEERIGFDLQISAFHSMTKELQARIAARPTIEYLTLDQLLDLVKERGGVANLSAEELSRLHKLSKNSD